MNMYRRLFILLLLVPGIVILSRNLEVRELLLELRDWMEGRGSLGAALFTLAYAFLVTLLVPASLLTVAAGTLFGPLYGIAVVSAASTLGAALAFLISRYLARSFVSGWISGRDNFRRLDENVNRHGVFIVAATRLIPLFPYTLLNYAFGLTGIPFGTYIFTSWLCMLPGTVLYVVGTDTVLRFVRGEKYSVFFMILLLFSAVLLTLLAKKFRKTMKGKDIR